MYDVVRKIAYVQFVESRDAPALLLNHWTLGCSGAEIHGDEWAAYRNNSGHSASRRVLSIRL